MSWGVRQICAGGYKIVKAGPSPPVGAVYDRARFLGMHSRKLCAVIDRAYRGTGKSNRCFFTDRSSPRSPIREPYGEITYLKSTGPAQLPGSPAPWNALSVVGSLNTAEVTIASGSVSM